MVPKDIRSAVIDWSKFSDEIGRGISANCAWSELVKADEGLARCERMLQAAESESRPATPTEIDLALRELMAGYLGHGKSEMAAFGVVLAKHIDGMSPSYFALRHGCEAVLLESKYFPSVATVCQAISGVESDVQALRDTIKRLRAARDSIQKVKDEYDRGREEARRTERRHQCFAAIEAGGDLSVFEPELVEGCKRWLSRAERA